MAYHLQNKYIELHIDHPLSGYTQARFDWTGKITTLKYRGRELSGSEIPDDTTGHYSGRGFYNEFGIDSPIGFRETAKGGWFHKIGIGLLQKEDDHYDFSKPYIVQPASFEVAAATDHIRINCTAPVISGYAYLLEKVILLLESGFEIQYHLQNTGDKPIMTNEYNHNFLSVDRELIGPDYALRFPFQIRPEHFSETVNPGKVVLIRQQEVTFKDSPAAPLFFSNLSGGEPVPAHWELTNTKSKIRISETGDFHTGQINLWGTHHVISPELFIPIHITPGQSQHWKRTYHIE